MASEIDELVELLENTSINIDVKYKGWECILGLTATDEGQNNLTNKKFITFLLSTLNKNEKNDPTTNLAYKCLINLSSSKEGALKLMSYKDDLIIDLLSKMTDPTHSHIEPMCYIVNNLSSHVSFLSDDEPHSFPIDKLKDVLKYFLSSEGNIREKYRFLALVFANVTNHVVGRKLFMENNSYLADLFIVPSNASESVIRRLGVSLTIRNCCFETDCHSKLLEELTLLPNILLPLMGPEEYKEEEMEKLPIDCQYLEESKEREEHPKIRRTLVQALCLLCYTEHGWNYLKENGVYYVTRELHNWEKDESVIEAIETLLLYLLVENYTAPDAKGKESILNTELVRPSETDVVKDLPDFII
ncbi:protein HGH1 homolog [Parasteatoda tepidariorum]|uniref:protein HGH1 homolog n=1 Tax=Parasteatoda tepidariorum TaxID=114398 RepID=UPI001C7252C8|nr:protein HGH1 homolog [Parasteatoda tepidariorum]